MSKGLSDAFLTEISNNYKVNINNNYSKNISKEILEHFSKYLKIFRKNNEYDIILQDIFSTGLLPELMEYVDKYLSLSKNTSFEYIASGSTTSCYRIGDYAFKLNKTKWSYEDVICPNLYLILKNLEEHYIRNEEGVVIGGLEVQKYLTRTADNLPPGTFSKFTEELRRLGYYSTDTLMYGICGDNCMLLDSYKDADYSNPEELPEFWKENPIVIVDRDRVYKLDNKRPKQLCDGY